MPSHLCMYAYSTRPACLGRRLVFVRESTKSKRTPKGLNKSVPAPHRKRGREGVPGSACHHSTALLIPWAHPGVGWTASSALPKRLVCSARLAVRTLRSSSASIFSGGGRLQPQCRIGGSSAFRHVFERLFLGSEAVIIQRALAMALNVADSTTLWQGLLASGCSHSLFQTRQS